MSEPRTGTPSRLDSAGLLLRRYHQIQIVRIKLDGRRVLVAIQQRGTEA